MLLLPLEPIPRADTSSELSFLSMTFYYGTKYSNILLHTRFLQQTPCFWSPLFSLRPCNCQFCKKWGTWRSKCQQRSVHFLFSFSCINYIADSFSHYIILKRVLPLILLFFAVTDYCTVNTKVDMRFNVKNAYWLSDRIRERIMQMVCYHYSLPYFFFCR